MQKIVTQKLFIACLACLTAVSIQAQLLVDSVGNIRINSSSNSTYKVDILSPTQGLQSTVKNSSLTTKAAIDGTSWHQAANNIDYGVRGRVFGYWLTGPCYGVYGATNTSSSSQNYGVWGSIAPNVSGAAIYGTIYYSSLALDDHYAGYFDGPVKVQGNFSVTGTMLNASAPSHTPSIITLQDLKSEYGATCSTRLLALSPKVYFYNQATDRNINDPLPADIDQLPPAESSLSLISKQILTKQHYGLDANQLEELFPDLVYENEDGTKSINYVEMVPILVQAINELKSEIEELKGVDRSAKKVRAQATAIYETDKIVAVLTLGQNKPNPFGASTNIEVSIPVDVQSAFICVYDLTGKKLQQVNITSRGKQTVTINASSLADGMYLYSLIADGKVMETRRMIVEK